MPVLCQCSWYNVLEILWLLKTTLTLSLKTFLHCSLQYFSPILDTVLSVSFRLFSLMLLEISKYYSRWLPRPYPSFFVPTAEFPLTCRLHAITKCYSFINFTSLRTLWPHKSDHKLLLFLAHSVNGWATLRWNRIIHKRKLEPQMQRCPITKVN